MKKLSRKEQRKKLIISIIFFFISIILILGYSIFHKRIYHQPLLQSLNNNNQDPISVEKILYKDPKLEELKKLYEENNDLVGWIKIDNTKIDYPVMYTKGEDYYLNHDFYKQEYKAGSIYIDKFNSVNPRDINLIIHGHSMKDGSMFRQLINYEDELFYKEHKNITFYTLEEKQEYTIISVFLSKVYQITDNVFKYYKFYGDKTEDEYREYINNIKKISLYDIPTTATYPEKLITLSTCEYSQENGRIVIVAKEK